MNILIENRQKKIVLNRRQIRHSLVKLLRYLRCDDVEISLVLVDDEEIRHLNRLYFDRDYPTNVISFSMAEGECGHVNPDILGDIVISVEKALLEGESAGLAFNEYLDFLIIHGLLHLLGYNHESGDAEETLRMMEKENELFMLLSGFALQR